MAALARVSACLSSAGRAFSARCRISTVYRQRSGEGRAGQTAHPGGDHRPPDAAADPRQSYGPLRDLERLADEYYRSQLTCAAPPSCAARFCSRCAKPSLDRELGLQLNEDPTAGCRGSTPICATRRNRRSATACMFRRDRRPARCAAILCWRCCASRGDGQAAMPACCAPWPAICNGLRPARLRHGAPWLGPPGGVAEVKRQSLAQRRRYPRALELLATPD